MHIIRGFDLHADPAHRPVRDAFGLALRLVIYLSIFNYLLISLSIYLYLYLYSER